MVPVKVYIRFQRPRILVGLSVPYFSTIPVTTPLPIQLPGILNRWPVLPAFLSIFKRDPLMWIQTEVLVSDMATTTPGPAHPFSPVFLLFRHTMTVSPFCTSSLGCVRGRASHAARGDRVVFCLKSAC